MNLLKVTERQFFRGVTEKQFIAMLSIFNLYRKKRFILQTMKKGETLLKIVYIHLYGASLKA